MEEEYTKIEQQPNDKQVPQGIFTAVTTKMKQYMFDKQDLDQSKTDQLSQYKRPVFIVNDMESTYINMKRSFQYVGDNSTFQKRITAILVVQWIVFSFMVNSIAFFFKTPVFLCKVPLTDIFIACTQSIACPLVNTQFVKIRTSATDQFFNFYQVSISEEFNLYCNNSDLAPWAQSAFFFGGFISGYLFSYVSQRIGRRLNLLSVLVLLAVSILFCALAPNYEWFLGGYFMIGFCLFGYETSIYIYIGEISATRFRTISMNILAMAWAGTPIFLPLLGLFPTWRYTFFSFFIVLLLTIPFVYYCFLESPRFLLSKKCYSKARQIFQKISITNQRPPYNFKLVQQIEQENDSYLTYTGDTQAVVDLLTKQMFPDTPKAYGYFDLFRYPSLKKPTLVLMYWWTFRFFMYYGLNLALESVLKSSFLLTVIISGTAIIEVFGSFGISILTTFCYNNYKLDIMRISLAIITICCLLLWFLEIGPDCVVMASQNELCLSLILMLVLVIVIKFFNTVFYSGLMVYYSQVFPTPIRSLGCGLTLTFGRLGTVMVPFYINYMKMKYYGKNSLCYMAPFGLFAVLLCFIMPYTEKEGMKEKIKEEQNENVFELNTL